VLTDCPGNEYKVKQAKTVPLQTLVRGETRRWKLLQADRGVELLMCCLNLVGTKLLLARAANAASSLSSKTGCWLASNGASSSSQNSGCPSLEEEVGVLVVLLASAGTQLLHWLNPGLDRQLKAMACSQCRLKHLAALLPLSFLATCSERFWLSRGFLTRLLVRTT